MLETKNTPVKKTPTMEGFVDICKSFFANQKNIKEDEFIFFDKFLEDVKINRIDMFAVFDIIRTFSGESCGENLKQILKTNNIEPKQIIENKENIMFFFKEKIIKKLKQEQDISQNLNLLTLKEASKILNLSEETLKTKIKNQELIGVQLSSRDWRILEKDLIHFVTQKRYYTIKTIQKNAIKIQKEQTLNTVPQKNIQPNNKPMQPNNKPMQPQHNHNHQSKQTNLKEQVKIQPNNNPIIKQNIPAEKPENKTQEELEKPEIIKPEIIKPEKDVNFIIEETQKTTHNNIEIEIIPNKQERLPIPEYLEDKGENS